MRMLAQAAAARLRAARAQWLRALKRPRTWIVVGLLAAIYTAVGFLLGPKLLRDLTLDAVEDATGRRASLRAVTFNPLLLRGEFRAFALADTDGSPMIAFERLVLDFSLRSLFLLKPVFRELRLEGPFVDVAIGANGSINLAELGGSTDKPSSGTAAMAAQEEGGLPDLVVDRLTLRNGKISITDRSRGHTFKGQLAPIRLTLTDFHTESQGRNLAHLKAESPQGESFSWRGSLHLAPFRSRGRVTIDALRATTLGSLLKTELPLRLLGGSIHFDARYAVDLGTTKPQLDITVREASVRKAAVGPKSEGPKSITVAKPWVEVDRIALYGTRLNLAKKAVRFPRVSIDGPAVHVRRDAKGLVNLARWSDRAAAPSAAGRAQTKPATVARADSQAAGVAATDPATTAAKRPATIAKPPPHTAKARNDGPENDQHQNDGPQNDGPQRREKPQWRVAIDELAVRNGSVDYMDAGFPGPAQLSIAALRVVAKGWRLRSAKPFDLDIRAKAVSGGELQLAGTLRPQPLAADLNLEVDGFTLNALAPFLAPFVSMDLRRGELSLQADLQLHKEIDQPLTLACQGSTRIDRLRVVDLDRRQDLLTWKRLALHGIALSYPRLRLTVKTVRLVEPYAHLVIDHERGFNLSRALKPRSTPESGGAATTAADTDTTDDAARPSPAIPSGRAQPPRPQLAIQTVELQRAKASFADLSLRPAFSVAMHSVSGTVVGLSSKATARGRVNLKGMLEDTGNVRITGTLNPLATREFADLTMAFRDIEVPLFNPYSTKWLSYAIAKGKLATDLRYRIVERSLRADHHVVIDQLELGEKKESPDAIRAPVKLGLALLRDENGVIDLELPVEGSLDDPDFSVWPIVWKMVRNLFVKAAVSPFKMLKEAIQGEDDFSFLDFAPGKAGVGLSKSRKIAGLARALRKRPSLRLAIPESLVAELDAPALAQQRLNNALSRYGEGNRGWEGLKRTYREVMGKRVRPPKRPAARAVLSDDAWRAQWTRTELLQTFRATETDLQTLGRKRAQAVRNVLKERHNLPLERLFVIANPDKVKPVNGKVRMILGIE